MTGAVNVRDFLKFVELFVVNEQVMADKIACEIFYNVFGVVIEFQWS